MAVESWSSRWPLAARLALVLTGVLVLVIGAYMAVSYAQRRALLGEEAARQVELLGAVLHLAAEEQLAAGRTDELDAMLRLALQAQSVVAALVIGTDGAPLAGDGLDLPCLLRRLPAVLPAHQALGTAPCGAGLHWALLPLRRQAAWLLIAIEPVLLVDAVRSALRRQVALLVVLALALSSVLALTMDRLLARPLADVAQQVRALAHSRPAPELALAPPPTGELAELASALHDTTRELEMRRTELVQRSEDAYELQRRLSQAEKFAMIGRLSGGLAHELGSPLSVIGMRAQTIELRAAEQPQIRDEARASGAEVARMASFVQGLLHLSGRHGVVFGRVDLREVVRRVADDVAQYAAGNGVDLAVDVPAGPIPVRGQEMMLCHALRNVVRNAIQAARTDAGERRVHMHVALMPVEVTIIVEDTGPGIAVEELAHVFEPFHTTKPLGEGIGLGLPITRGIIEEHGGEVTIANRPEGGVRLALSLPLDTADRP